MKRKMPWLCNPMQILQIIECAGQKNTIQNISALEDRAEPQASTDNKEIKLSALYDCNHL